MYCLPQAMSDEKQNNRSGEMKSEIWITAARQVVDDGGGQRE